MESQIKPPLVLGTLKVSKIKGKFSIPDYQRGFRWEASQVKALLEDIYENGANNYWLQPIVVCRRAPKEYELVDGQQRLTTLLLVFKYLQANKGVTPLYSITYQTRIDTESYINDITDEQKRATKKNDDPDFFFICNAYEAILEWVHNKAKELVEQEEDDITDEAVISNKSITIRDKIYGYLYDYVYVIWYELDASQPGVNPSETFRNLNYGHIGLTDSELVKALFLCQSRNRLKELSTEKQEEISLLWNEVEREMHDEDFWAFLTTKKQEDFPARIELLFDFLAGKQDDEKDPHYTFEYFNTLATGRRVDGTKVGESHDLTKIWEDIYSYYLRLKEWHSDPELYHKIGYLVTSGYKTIYEIYTDAKELGRKKLSGYLNKEIAQSILFYIQKGQQKFFLPYHKLNYDNHYDEIFRLLLLFNTQCAINKNQHLPFQEFQGRKGSWSLEHIHAQKSTSLNTEKKRTTWINNHIPSVRRIGKLLIDKGTYDKTQYVSLLTRMEKHVDKVTGEDFNEIFNEVIVLLTPKEEDTRYIDMLSNMALLKGTDNTSISNYSFDVKRRQIIKLEKKGHYIPYGTMLVFSKQFNEEQEETQLFFWGEEDRDNYLHEIDDVLRPYLNIINTNLHIYTSKIIDDEL